MITLSKVGIYKLTETRHNTKILYLDNSVYAWVETDNIGEMLVTSHTKHKTDCVLSVGHYRLYKVKNEHSFSDHQHLELEVGKDIWQGYLLLTGLPKESKPRVRIVPTHEVVTGYRHSGIKNQVRNKTLASTSV